MTVGIARRSGGKWVPWLSAPGMGTTTPTVKPVAAFTTSVKDLVVSFDGSTSRSVNGGIVSYAWNFDDDRTGTGATTSHTYAAAGTYNPSLTITDATGLSVTLSKSVTVTAPVVTGDRSTLVAGTYKPDATTTGLLPGWAKSQLTKFTTVTGKDSGGVPYWTPTSGTTYKNTWFNVRVVIGAAKGVKFQNCWFDGGTVVPPATQNTALVDCTSAANTANNVVIEDSVFALQLTSVAMNGINGRGYTIRRCNIYGSVDGCGAFYNGAVNVLVEACWIHDLAYLAPDPNHSDNHTHNDGIQIQGGSNITIRGSRIEVNVSTTASNAKSPYGTSVTGQAIGITPNVAQVTDVLIEQNWLDYGASTVTIIAGSKGGSNIGVIRNNRFGRNQPTVGGRKRPLVLTPASTVSGMPSATGADSQGNVYADTNTPITVYREAS